ncbi:Wadjet anti-phage system protein JetA family protein [Rhizobium sp. 18055]|uniref:Wadjet anti-phage system protein JetA family protein n=1 Tax=Rhizobium sp. 18055 TaxID=2681403 RepID=UPI001FCE7ADF|nr:Wadjet anti-phage system protein JetA family protein [Rhizobium sp. 18055]
MLEVYDRFFSSGAVFPTPQELIHAIYDVIARRPELLLDADDPAEGLPEVVSKGRRRLKFAGHGDEAGDRALKAAQQVYQGLVRTGWLEEEEYGLKVTTDMPMGALLVVQRLSSLKSDVSQRFGGLVVHIKASLELVEKLSSENRDKPRSNAAHVLREARVQAGQFVKTLRAILSDLRRIRKSLMESEDIRQKMDTYFEEFIGELILKDFQAILTFNHPYRFRDQIVGTARRISYSADLVPIIAEGYLEIGIAKDIQQAREEAVSDLLSIETTFDTVGEMFERIAQFRRALETRLRNTVKYAEQGERGLSSRARGLVGRLEALLAANPGQYAEPTVPAAVERVFIPWSQGQLAPQRQARLPIAARPLAQRPYDPVYAFRKRMRADYLDRISPSPERVRQFLARTVASHHTVEARFITIGSVDDFLAFDAVRRYALTREIPSPISTQFALEYLPNSEPHDCEWLRCSNFSIRHIGVPSHREARHAE